MDIYSLLDNKYIPQLNTVDNFFIRQLYGLAVTNAKNYKMLGILLNNPVNGNKTVLDICQLPALLDKENCKNIVEDVAKYRWGKLDFNFDKDFWKERSNLLFLDYILSSCLCYVEVYDDNNGGKKSNNVDKFYATRNRFIAARIAEIEDNETSKYVNYLTPVLADYRIGSLRVLKLNRQKKGFKITQPRSAINFNKSVRVTPLFFIGAFMQGITPLLKDNIVKFKYIKDNGQERELITTLSKDVFTKYYGSVYAEDIISKYEMKMDRGYLRVPELGCSKYDDSGLRALNINRITSLETVDSFDSSYIEVDFNTIIPTFKATVEAIRNVQAVGIIYQTLMGENPGDKDIITLRSEIMTYVDGRFAIGTTTFQKELHNYKLKYNMVFKGYNGKPNKLSLEMPNNFNLGLE